MTDTEPEQFTFDFFKEEPHIVGGSSDELKLTLGKFAGPLDLLLYLIKQEQANIFDIPIARITDEYLKYVRLMKSLDIAVAADFLVMAATLIEIKSKMLLPRDPSAVEEEEFEDPRKELVDRLLEYEKYKSAAQMLYERTTIEQAVFARGRIEFCLLNLLRDACIDRDGVICVRLFEIALTRFGLGREILVLQNCEQLAFLDA